VFEIQINATLDKCDEKPITAIKSETNQSNS